MASARGLGRAVSTPSVWGGRPSATVGGLRRGPAGSAPPSSVPHPLAGGAAVGGSSASGARPQAYGHLLLAPTLDRGGDAQSFAIFGHRAPRDIDAVAL